MIQYQEKGLVFISLEYYRVIIVKIDNGKFVIKNVLLDKLVA